MAGRRRILAQLVAFRQTLEDIANAFAKDFVFRQRKVILAETLLHRVKERQLHVLHSNTVSESTRLSERRGDTCYGCKELHVEELTDEKELSSPRTSVV